MHIIHFNHRIGVKMQQRSCVCHCWDFFFFFATGYPGFQTTTYTSRSYTGIAPGYTYQFPGECVCRRYLSYRQFFHYLLLISAKWLPVDLLDWFFNVIVLFSFLNNYCLPVFLCVFFGVYITSLRNSCVLPTTPPFPFVQPSCLSSQYFLLYFLLNVLFCGFVVRTMANELTQHCFSRDLFCP